MENRKMENRKMENRKKSKNILVKSSKNTWLEILVTRQK
jgi:hypothetical protein